LPLQRAPSCHYKEHLLAHKTAPTGLFALTGLRRFLILNMHLLDHKTHLTGMVAHGQDRFLILNMHLTGRIAHGLLALLARHIKSLLDCSVCPSMMSVKFIVLNSLLENSIPMSGCVTRKC
jgi:hypothetical protein